MADAWSVGVRIIANTGSIDAALVKLGLGLFGLQGQADKLAAKLGIVTTRMLGIGGASIAAGREVLKVYMDVAKAGDKIVQLQNQMRLSGISNSIITGVTEQSSRLATEIPGTTTSGIMETWAKLRPTLGDKDASLALPGTERILAGLSVQFPDIATQFETISKALDLFGGGMNKVTHQFDANTWNVNLDAIARAVETSHGLLSPSTLLQIARGGGVMAQGTDFPKFLAQMQALFVEQGARAGTGLMALQSEFIGGKVTKRTTEALIHYGLLDPKGVTSDHGVYSVADPSKSFVGGADILTKGFGYWIKEDVLPTLAKHGVDISNTAQVIQALTKIFGEVRAARVGQTLATPTGRQMADRDEAQTLNAINNGASWDTANTETLEGAMKSVSAAWTDMEEKLGHFGKASQTVITVVDDLSSVMRRFNGILASDPGDVEKWVTRFGELGVALTAFGGTAVVAAIARMVGPKGGLLALTAGIVALGDASGNPWLANAAEGALVGGQLAGLPGAIAGAIASGFWNAPHPAWLDQTPQQLAGELCAAFHDSFLTAAADFAGLITDAKRWEAAAMAFTAVIEKDMTSGLATLWNGAKNEAGKLLKEAPLVPQLQSYHIPDGNQTVLAPIDISLKMDGNVIGKHSMAYQAKFLTAPQTGPTGYNMRASAPTSGQAINT
jgi:hypothetical protein